jgi:hypothetical protein
MKSCAESRLTYDKKKERGVHVYDHHPVKSFNDFLYTAGWKASDEVDIIVKKSLFRGILIIL